MDRDFLSLIKRVTQEIDDIVRDPKHNLGALHEGFPFWIVDNLLDNMDTDDAEIGVKGNEHGIDICKIDTEEKIITFGQAKWSDTFEHNLDGNDISRLATAPLYLLDDKVKGNESFDAIKKEFQKIHETGEGYKINFVLVVAGELTPGQKTEIEAQNAQDTIQLKDKTYSVIGYEAWDKDEIYDKIFHPKTEDITLDFEGECKDILPYQHDKRPTAFIIIRGTQLNQKLKKEFYRPLFEYNPRFYKGLKGSAAKKINLKLKETAEDAEESKNFLEYNNGITSICDEFNVNKNSIDIKNLKIVNGCQTIVTLARSNVHDNVNVLFKLYQIDEKDKDLKENISVYTNSQNPISERDQNSNHKLQLLIQRNIEADYDGFFWERKEGERIFHEGEPSWKRLYSPVTLRIIDNKKVAKFVYAYSCQDPYGAVMLKEKDVFDEKDLKFKEVFGRERDYVEKQKKFVGTPAPIEDFILSWIFQVCLTRSFTFVKKSKNQTDSKIKYDSIIKLSGIDFFKHTCLALLGFLLDKNPNPDEVKKAIIKIMSKNARINSKPLSLGPSSTTNKIGQYQLDKIIPIFVFLFDRLEVTMRGKFFDDNNISTLDTATIVSKIGKSTSYGDIKAKIETLNDENNGALQNDLDAKFAEIIAQAQTLDP